MDKDKMLVIVSTDMEVNAVLLIDKDHAYVIQDYIQEIGEEFYSQDVHATDLVDFLTTELEKRGIKCELPNYIEANT